MKIQISTDYAIRILQYLHMHEDKEELHTAMKIAGAIDVTYPFFIKIANILKKKGLINSVQGRNGGYTLGQPAHEISLYDVFVCIEGELLVNRCLEGRPCTKGKHKNCTLKEFLSEVQKDLVAKWSSQTIADLAN